MVRRVVERIAPLLGVQPELETEGDPATHRLLVRVKARAKRLAAN